MIPETADARVALRPLCLHGGIATFTQGTRETQVPYRHVQEGENLAGQCVLTVYKDGRFERIDTGPKGASWTGRSIGPAQVATDMYRTSWERTFGDRGGIS